MGRELHHPAFPLVEVLAKERRAALFAEAPTQTLRRWMLGTAWALKPARIAGLPALGRMWLANAVTPPAELPRPEDALAQPRGFCGFAQDLSVPTLVEAYRIGIYPFAHVGPQKWWSPPERCVLSFDEFHIPKRLRGRLRQARHRVTFDQDFEAVIKACAEPREGKWQLTWITPPVMRAFAALHDAGYAHSFEVWDQAGTLVGGGYGVAVGGAFTIESQFTRESNTSKIGFAALNWHLAKWGFILNDNKGSTHNTLEMGFRLVPRAEFQARLAEAGRHPDRCGRWQVEADLPTIADWYPQKAASNAVAAPPPEKKKASKAARSAALVPIFEAFDGEMAILSNALAMAL